MKVFIIFASIIIIFCNFSKSQIVYTNFNGVGIPIANPIDLDNDGISDIRFYSFYQYTLCYYEPNGDPIYADADKMQTCNNFSNYNQFLPFGSLVSNNLNYSTFPLVLFYYCSNTGIHGIWPNRSEAYVALKINKDNNTYYGWIHLSSSQNVWPDTVTEFAYNSIPDSSIYIGQTSFISSNVFNENCVNITLKNKELFIEFNTNQIYNPLIEIYNITGKKIFNSLLFDQVNIIKIDDILHGVYIIKVVMLNKIIVHKIIF
jgi:hypothetical protein